MSQYKEGAGNTVLNKDLKQTGPVSGFPYVLITNVKFKNCDQGIPTETELSSLYRLSDSVYANVTAHVKNIMAGTFTYQCERMEYYYLVDTVGIRDLLVTLFQKHFSTYEPGITIKADKNWDAYLKFLHPNEETLEYTQNEKILMSLEQQGDKPEKERRVDHWILFATEKDMDYFIPYATSQHFKVEEKTKNRLRISRMDKIALPIISKITTELKKEAKKYNGVYDGWKTTIVK
ncbi:DUF695 domain-containing protein [Chitinophaga sp. S165]|uniref:DUF695 domain-containing protein n=1 Tax=Chitinophaga sp. S165 TaxID=2135462 RepID=UPI001304D638|nr:DUF695 domain-containing protein [Chitinophaga sp. S165]